MLIPIQDLSGSNEMLFIPGVGQQAEQQLYHAPGPKIAYSYQHDPKVTPMRKISTNSYSSVINPSRINQQCFTIIIHELILILRWLTRQRLLLLIVHSVQSGQTKIQDRYLNNRPVPVPVPVTKWPNLPVMPLPIP